MFLPTIVVDGQITGTWKRQAKQRSFTTTLSDFESTPIAEHLLASSIGRYQAFLGIEATLPNPSLYEIQRIRFPPRLVPSDKV